jgi:peptidoglycan/xylan/chitin deacetylase (PgdA/CDA1 family)
MMLLIAFRMKKILSAIAENSGILSLILNKSGKNSSLILMYHRVVEPEKTVQLLEPGMYVTPNTFEAHIKFLKKHYKISTIKDIVPQYKKKEDEGSLEPPHCVLTFDDGWRDFYTNAYPLLKRYQIPATVFLPTDFIGSESWFWMDRLAYLISMCREDILLDVMRRDIRKPITRQLSRLHGSSRARLDKAIQILKSCPEETIEETLSDLSAQWGIRAGPPARAFLSWEEVEELSRSGFVEFGSHTASHQILPILDDNTVRHELDSSRSELINRRAVDPDFIPFCYPNGNMDERIVKMVREAGYGAAVTTMPGWNPRSADPFILKRVGIHQDMTCNTAMFGCRIAGWI